MLKRDMKAGQTVMKRRRPVRVGVTINEDFYLATDTRVVTTSDSQFDSDKYTFEIPSSLKWSGYAVLTVFQYERSSFRFTRRVLLRLRSPPTKVAQPSMKKKHRSTWTNART